MPRTFSTRLSFLLTLPVSLSALALGCSTGKGNSDPLVTAKAAGLHQAADCEDLLGQIQADAVAKLDLQVAQYNTSYARGGVISVDDGTSNSADGSGDLGVGMPSAPGGDNSAGGGEGAAPDNHSETNTQVVGVDEADIVKTDGERIYLLHGDEFFLIDAWPADQTRVLGSVKVEGSGFEMFVHDGKATLFSTVYPSDIPTTGGSSSSKPMPDCYDCGGYGANSFTKISVFDVTADAPTLEREMIFEGYYVSGRRHGDVVRTVVQGGFKGQNLYYPSVSSYDSFGRPKAEAAIAEELDQWRDRTASEIETTVLEDWVPRRFEREGGNWQELDAECDSYFVPEPGRVADGVTQVVTFDTKKNRTPHVVAVLGGAETVYANNDVLVLGQTDYSWNWSAADSTRTMLHQFSIDGETSSYEASGFVPGYLHNQFSIDEQAGVVRVSTTETIVKDRNSWVTDTANRVFTLRAEKKELGIIGKTEPLGEVNETIFATRFIGDRGYVVTFERTDPLIVVDLGDAAHPSVLGELHIPGFSDYIHPLPNHQLLTIGQDADDSGMPTGVALQIFDVSDPAHPKQAHKKTFGGFSYSEASYNHKAFTFVDDKFGNDQGLLMFPITTYDPTYSSRLEVLKVSATDGFTSLGSIDHASLLLQSCETPMSSELGNDYCYYSGNDMRRGVQIGSADDDFVYAISYGGITVHPLDDLATQVATVALPAPQYSDYYYGGIGAPGAPGVEDGGSGVGGAAPTEPAPPGK